ncbi:MAG: hypothetical protein NC094_05355 [Bacteroidales bacterium]|nr:hypothetical protein [Lachnoclostridium sp.]MCM1384163.1 hypothetical protein [Lachnoclostridium sp.]MCM1464829.1 hypothetical protein [Bacteroidales bacterium]
MDTKESIEEKKYMQEKKIWIGLISAAIVLAGILALFLYVAFSSKEEQGYQDYRIQKEQYFMEYSEHFDYWDVVTVEYPRLEGIDEELQEQINTAMYDMAMDRTRFWHLRPSKEIAAYQKESYWSLFCSDVNCDIDYHSQYLASVHYCEYYAPKEPVYHTKYTERAINVDLMTGEIYELSDVFRIDEGFIKLWMQSMNAEYEGAFTEDEATVEILLDWFHKEDEELNELYEFRPYFYLTEEKDFVIGISLDPLLAGLTQAPPENSTYNIKIEADKLKPYRTDSGFWEKYEKSEMAGEVLPCKNKQSNLWLGEEASVWGYWDER